MEEKILLRIEEVVPDLELNLDALSRMLTEIEKFILNTILTGERAFSVNELYSLRVVNRFQQLTSIEDSSDEARLEFEDLRRRLTPQEIPSSKLIKRTASFLSKYAPFSPESFLTIDKAVEQLISWGVLAKREGSAGNRSVVVISPRFYTKYKGQLENTEI